MSLLKRVLLVSICFLVGGQIHSQNQGGEPGPGGEEVTPAHVFLTISVLRGEIDLIRKEMGRPHAGSPIIHVEKASPREVYYQGLSLYRKAARLALELCREEVEEPSTPSGTLEPEDVDAVLKAAAGRIGKVKSFLSIPEEVDTPTLDPDIEPTDVYNSIASANRDLNLLLDRRFAPGDVYREISVAIAYASRLLDSPGKVSTPPEPPAFERWKRPSDVYVKLVESFVEIRGISEISGVRMLDLTIDEEQVKHAEPGDVYDLASLIVAELSYFHSLKKGALPPREVYSAGRKIPSDVYQRLGLLRKQIDMLRERVEGNPGWLTDD